MTIDIAALRKRSSSLRTADQTDAFIDKLLDIIESTQVRIAELHKVKHWREAPCNGVDWAKRWKEGWNACVKQVESVDIFVKDDDQ